MGVRRFLSFLRQKSTSVAPILMSMANELFANTSVGIDANNYFYKFLNTEEDSAAEIEQIFCALTCAVHDTVALTVIQEHLMQCETSSERHLLRCLYIFSMFCYRSLQIRHIIFVLDGAAPLVKLNELVERKQQKRTAHGKMLNEQRSLLLHRIYLLRWYQILCIAWGFLQNNNELLEQPPSICHKALFRLLQQSFEWALGTELPEEMFKNAAQTTFLAQVNSATASVMLEMFSRLRLTVQTSFLVEFDFTDVSPQFIETVLPILFHDHVTVVEPARTPRPFLVCIHIKTLQKAAVEQFVTGRNLDQSWQDCLSAYLICIVLHENNAECKETASFITPVSFKEHATATAAFAHWETQSKQYWCNRDNFPHQHQHIWRTIEYAAWLCSDKSNDWLRLISTTTTATETVITDVESKRLMQFYGSVPILSFSDMYDTRNDESHYNLYWNESTMTLFQSKAMPQTIKPSQIANEYSLSTFMKNFFQKKRTTGKRSFDNHTNITAEQFGLSEQHKILATHVEERHRQHIRHRLRDAYMQIVVHFLRVVCCVQAVVAEHEAEATCAKLCRDQFVNFVFTDDLDALAFGSPNIIMDWPSIRDIGNSLLLMGGTLTPKFCAKIITRSTLLNYFSISNDQLLMWCVLMGTDFSTVANHISIPQLLDIVTKSTSVEQCVSQLVSAEEADSGIVAKVEKVFQFFATNQTLPQTEFLIQQFAPLTVDETINLHKICANRKMGFVEE